MKTLPILLLLSFNVLADNDQKVPFTGGGLGMPMGGGMAVGGMKINSVPGDGKSYGGMGIPGDTTLGKTLGGIGPGITGGVQGGIVPDTFLANCKKEDDGQKISCPDGIYIKSSSVVDSDRGFTKELQHKVQTLDTKKGTASGQ